MTMFAQEMWRKITKPTKLKSVMPCVIFKMQLKKISFDFRGRKFSFTAKKCSIFSSGLMFRSRKTRPCLFKFPKPNKFKITSFFVFFPFLAIWLDDKNKVLEIKVVGPFTFEITPKHPSSRLLEVPLNRENAREVKFLVDKMGRHRGERRKI